MDFWQIHGIWFILFLALFPRFTMLVTGVFSAFFGFWFFLGWLILPRLTVAILASIYYFDTNPVLCIMAWFWAVSLEYVEKSNLTDNQVVINVN